MFKPNRLGGRRGLLVCSRLLRHLVNSFSNDTSPPSFTIGLSNHHINHMFGAYEEVLSTRIRYLRQSPRIQQYSPLSRHHRLFHE
ncbi:hypothetical protein AAHC03_076 [Spirometra sp. Aus1]